MRCLVLVVAMGACGRGGEPKRRPEVAPAPPVAAADAAEPTCTRLPFEASTPVPEASGAAWIDVEGRAALLVISDSGNDGAYAIVAADAGETLEQGKLPLGGGNDDLEGIALRGGKYYVLASPGLVRAYERAGRGFRLVDGPYRISDDERLVCGTTNCGRNYEGLCLTPSDTGARCIGFAASKADGRLYCVVMKEGRLVAEHDGSIAVTRGGVMADCAFADDGRLFTGSNLFDLANVYRIDGWRDPATAKVARLGPLGIGFPEAIAVRGDAIYRMSDKGDAPSAMTKYSCRE